MINNKRNRKAKYKKMKNHEHVDYIDTLRFLSVLFILFTHFDTQCYFQVTNVIMFERFLSATHIASFLFSGWTGKYALALMCVISGWCVAKAYQSKETRLEQFIVNRYIRLVVPVLIVSTIIYMCSFLGENHISVGEYVASAFYLGTDFLNPHLWCIDEIFIGSVVSQIMFMNFKEERKNGGVYTL